MKTRKEEWIKILADWKKSGLRAADYCRQKGIANGAFYSAKKACGVPGPSDTSKAGGKFLKLSSDHHGAAELNGSIRVTLKGGAYIDVSSHNAEGLKTVLSVLEGIQ